MIMIINRLYQNRDSLLKILYIVQYSNKLNRNKKGKKIDMIVVPRIMTTTSSL